MAEEEEEEASIHYEPRGQFVICTLPFSSLVSPPFILAVALNSFFSQYYLYHHTKGGGGGRFIPQTIASVQLKMPTSRAKIEMINQEFNYLLLDHSFKTFERER